MVIQYMQLVPVTADASYRSNVSVSPLPVDGPLERSISPSAEESGLVDRLKESGLVLLKRAKRKAGNYKRKLKEGRVGGSYSSLSGPPDNRTDEQKTVDLVSSIGRAPTSKKERKRIEEERRIAKDKRLAREQERQDYQRWL